MKKILVVEDDIDIHNLLKNILEEERYKVISAYSGTEAVLLIEKNDIDLILLDLMLPGLIGEEIVKKVTNIPIIVISAKVSSEDKVNVLSNGANDYITKPFDTNELLARIKVQLRINKKEQNSNLMYKDMLLDKATHTLYIKKENVILSANLAVLTEYNKGIQIEFSERSNQKEIEEKYLETLLELIKKYNINIIWHQELKGVEKKKIMSF